MSLIVAVLKRTGETVHVLSRVGDSYKVIRADGRHYTASANELTVLGSSGLGGAA